MTNVFQQSFNVVIPADADPIPTTVITGSSAGNPSQINIDRNFARWPRIDGVNETLPASPTSVDGTITYDLSSGAANIQPNTLPTDDFLSWHVGHQLEYLANEGTTTNGVTFVRLTQNGNTTQTRLDAIVNAEGTDVIILQQLTKNDIAQLSSATQALLAQYLADLSVASNRTFLESAWGVQAKTSADGASTAGAEALADINALKTLIGSSNLTASEQALFTGQLDNMITRLGTTAFVSRVEIGAQVQAIQERFERANAFKAGLTAANASLDNNVTITNGFNNFITQETRILALDNQRLQLSQFGSLGGRALDAPSLIALLQLYYNLDKEAKVAAETEEVQQQNALLRDYAQMQNLVNDALQSFSTGENGSKEDRNINGSQDAQTLAVLSATERTIVRMFDQGLAASNHPIEVLRNIPRQTEDIAAGVIIDSNVNILVEKSQNSWNIFATQLSDTVTLINQQSQILTNEISSLNRERNRHFDLANNALRRLNETLNTIARI